MASAGEDARGHRTGRPVHADRSHPGLQEGDILRDPGPEHEESTSAPTLYTVGHGTRTIKDFIALLTNAGIRRLVDVRTAPGSRRHPQFAKDALAEALGERGISYAWKKELGGWRKPKPGSIHVALRSSSFRGYADHMETTEFEDAASWLIGSSTDRPTAVMCAESLWWRCHRRMLADALTARGCTVLHILDGGIQPHTLHTAARIVDDSVVYDRGEDRNARAASTNVSSGSSSSANRAYSAS